jgi:hypothetical protein
MAQIISYPVATPASADYLVGSQTTTSGAPINPTKKFLLSAVVEAGLGYKVYTALLSQTGAVNPPTAIELKNDTGATMTYTRSGPGVYVVTASSGIFTANKTVVFINNGSLTVGMNSPEWTRSAPTAITIDTGGADTKLASASFEIRIYD